MRSESRSGAALAVVASALLLLPATASGAKKRPELVVAKVGDPPATLAAGSTLTVTDKVRNKGRRSKRSKNAYFLSPDEFHDLADVRLNGSRRVPKLKRGKASAGAAELVVPAAILTGNYRLISCADATRRVRERTESNNCRASVGEVSVAGMAPPDTTPPAAPTITATTPDDPANDNNPEVSGTGAEAGSTVRIYAGECSGTPIGAGSAADFGGAGITVTVPDDQTTQLRATATDGSGNESACSAPFTYIENSDLPVAPTITDTDPDSPANDNNPEVKGSGAEAGATVRVHATGNCTGSPIATGSAAAFNGGGITVAVLDNTSNVFTARVVDAAGNESACSASFGYIEDSIGPGVPTITGTEPISPSNDNTPAVIGSGAEAGSTVRLYASSTCAGSVIGTGSALEFNGEGIPVATPLPSNAATDLTSRATDDAGNQSGCSAPFTYVEDSSPPPAPTSISTDPPSPADDNNPEIKGTGAEPGATVRVFATGNCSLAPVATGSAEAFNGGGITVSVGDDTSNTFTARVIDDAGNQSVCSAPVTYVEDSTP